MYGACMCSRALLISNLFTRVGEGGGGLHYVCVLVYLEYVLSRIPYSGKLQLV